MPKILLAEQDQILAATVKKELEKNAFIVAVVHDGEDASYYLRSYGYELIILDFDLPRLTGMEVCRAFRVKNQDTPIIFLTDGHQIPDPAFGYSPDTDDCLNKPFPLEELMLQVRNLLNRAAGMNGKLLKAGDVEMEPDQGRVYKAAIEVKLSATEFAVLECLLRNRGNVVASAVLIDSCWPSDPKATSGELQGCLDQLRRRIDDRGQPSLIKEAPEGYVIE